MLRALVVLLVLVNMGFFGWTRGWLTAVTGMDPTGDHEPQRLKAQVQAQSIHVLGPVTTAATSAAIGAPSQPPTTNAATASADGATAAAVMAAASGPVALIPAGGGDPAVAVSAVCLEAGPFTQAEVPRLEPVLRDTLPSGTWTLQPRDAPAAAGWMVYVGKFADRDALRARTEELRRQNVRFDEVHGAPDLEPGLSLGRFETEAAAREELRKLGQRSVRGGRIVTAPALPATYRLRIEQADGLLMALALRLKDRMMGHSLAICPS